MKLEMRSKNYKLTTCNKKSCKTLQDVNYYYMKQNEEQSVQRIHFKHFKIMQRIERVEYEILGEKSLVLKGGKIIIQII